MQINVLWSAVMSWVGATGATRLNEQPGLWKRHTVEAAGIGPFVIKVNPHEEEIDGVQPFDVVIGDDASLPGAVAILGPGGGVVLVGGPGEDGLIKHFQAQPEHGVKGA